jgi:hypothetical protein
MKTEASLKNETKTTKNQRLLRSKVSETKELRSKKRKKHTTKTAH